MKQDILLVQPYSHAGSFLSRWRAQINFICGLTYSALENACVYYKNL